MKPVTIALVDYEAGNVRSVQRALERFGLEPRLASDARSVATADGLVFPGQGSNDSSMRRLRALDLVEPLKDFVASGKPFLGVCLGLQLLFEGSDEGSEPGLGLLSGHVRHLPAGQKIPHMGWNQVQLRGGHPFFDGVPTGSYFYFVHSYYADPGDDALVAGTTDYGLEFCSAVARGNLIGVQFHPEKSGAVGLRLYENFVRLVDAARERGAWKSSLR